jgi:hypothetical protein
MDVLAQIFNFQRTPDIPTPQYTLLQYVAAPTCVKKKEMKVVPLPPRPLLAAGCSAECSHAVGSMNLCGLMHVIRPEFWGGIYAPGNSCVQFAPVHMHVRHAHF